jgi:hypothetical protein
MTNQAKKAVLDATFQRVEAAIISSLSDADTLVLARIHEALAQARQRIETDRKWLDNLFRATDRPTDS